MKKLPCYAVLDQVEANENRIKTKEKYGFKRERAMRCSTKYLCITVGRSVLYLDDDLINLVVGLMKHVAQVVHNFGRTMI